MAPEDEMLSERKPWVLDLDAAVREIGDPVSPRFRDLFHTQGVSVEIYHPRGTDLQQPHDRDELYFIARGEGWFWSGQERAPCKAGAAIFVPAGQPHRFEDFSADFVTWVVFFGAVRPRTGPGLFAKM